LTNLDNPKIKYLALIEAIAGKIPNTR
jgi:hypothetical protein